MLRTRVFATFLAAVIWTGCVAPSARGRAASSPAASVAAPAPSPASTPRAQFGFDDVSRLAEKLASGPYAAPEEAPEPLAKLGYDEYRDIRFKADRALWKDEGLPFQVQFFHPGFIYRRPVRFHVVDGAAREVPFSADLFDYGENRFDGAPPRASGFAGFRVHHPINRGDYFDEIIVFLGASYFRAVPKGAQYGLSARAIAVNTASPTGEEFPEFREFWAVKPAPGDATLTIYALLDGPSLAGAYAFTVRPGEETVVDVRARVWLRRDVAKLGLAPLTSMFLFGENGGHREARQADFRPEVHDSDGFLYGGKEGDVWRPLVNYERLFVNGFDVESLDGFGLLQRDGAFDHYQDLEARYELRPGAWISPRPEGGIEDVWSRGRAELVQIPTRNEYNDNIVAYWVPERPATAGSSLAFAYRMRWSRAVDRSRGRVESTRVAERPEGRAREIVVDFAGPALEALAADAPVEADVEVADPGTKLVSRLAYKNTVTGGWRLVFVIEREKRQGLGQVLPPDEPAETRARLKLGEEVLTETWSYAVDF